MSGHPDQLLLDAAADLRSAMESLGRDLRSVELYGRRTRRIIRLVGLSVALDVCLSLGLGAIAIQSRHASDKATKASSALVVSCRAGNESRKIESDLWNTVLAFPQPKPTPEQEASTAKFKTYIATAFAPKKCGG